MTLSCHLGRIRLDEAYHLLNETDGQGEDKAQSDGAAEKKKRIRSLADDTVDFCFVRRRNSLGS